MMKRILIFCLSLTWTLSASAQSVMILHSLDMVDNATALTHYYNLFGSFNMPERDHHVNLGFTRCAHDQRSSTFAYMRG